MMMIPCNSQVAQPPLSASIFRISRQNLPFSFVSSSSPIVILAAREHYTLTITSIIAFYFISFPDSDWNQRSTYSGQQRFHTRTGPNNRSFSSTRCIIIDTRCSAARPLANGIAKKYYIQTLLLKNGHIVDVRVPCCFFFFLFRSFFFWC